MKLESASGGYVMNVNKEGRGETIAVTVASVEHFSEYGGYAFAWSNVTYDPDAADTIILIKNDHTTKKLHIKGIQFSSDTASEVIVHLTDGATFTPTGTAIVGVNLNNAVGGIPLATAKGDETANTQGNIIFHTKVLANTPNHWDMNGAIILGTNQSIGVDLVTAATAAFATIWGFYSDV